MQHFPKPGPMGFSWQACRAFLRVPIALLAGSCLSAYCLQARAHESGAATAASARMGLEPLFVQTVLRHFRIQSMDRLLGKPEYRIVLRCTSNVSLPVPDPKTNQSPWAVKGGELLFGTITDGKDSQALITLVGGEDADGVAYLLPEEVKAVSIPLYNLSFLAGDDVLVFEALSGRKRSRSNKDATKFETSLKDATKFESMIPPLDVNLFTGWSFSNLYQAPGDTQNFFKSKGMVRLEAQQFLWISPMERKLSGVFVLGQVNASVFPASFNHAAPSGQDVIGAIRETHGFVGEASLLVGYALSEHSSFGLGYGLKTGTYRETSGATPSSQVVNDKTYTQAGFLLRLSQHDPKWRGSFLEWSPVVKDPYFELPGRPDASRRTLVTAQAVFRPDSWTAAAWYMESTINRSLDRSPEARDENRIAVGVRLDLRNLSFSF